MLFKCNCGDKTCGKGIKFDDLIHIINNAGDEVGGMSMYYNDQDLENIIKWCKDTLKERATKRIDDL